MKLKKIVFYLRGNRLHPDTPGAEVLRVETPEKGIKERGIRIEGSIGNVFNFSTQKSLEKGAAPGPKVTNAKPGYSWHNFGVAWDFAVFDEQGQPQWESPLMERCGEIGESLGLEWGGRWKGIKDTPHLQLKTGLSLAEARQRVIDGKQVV